MSVQLDVDGRSDMEREDTVGEQVRRLRTWKESEWARGTHKLENTEVRTERVPE
jgi:hypothetical protein